MSHAPHGRPAQAPDGLAGVMELAAPGVSLPLAELRERMKVRPIPRPVPAPKADGQG